MTRVLVDCDGVLADLVGALCVRLRMAGFDRQPEHITEYYFQKALTPPELIIVDEAMRSEGFVKSMVWYPGAQEFVRKLHALGDVVAVTRPYEGSRTWPYERDLWLRGHCDKIVHTAHKEMIRGDYLIEDSTDNALKWAQHWPGGTAYLIARPWVRPVAAANVEWCPDYTSILRKIAMRAAL